MGWNRQRNELVVKKRINSNGASRWHGADVLERNSGDGGCNAPGPSCFTGRVAETGNITYEPLNESWTGSTSNLHRLISLNNRVKLTDAS